MISVMFVITHGSKVLSANIFLSFFFNFFYSSRVDLECLLISAVQQSDLVLYIYIYIKFIEHVLGSISPVPPSSSVCIYIYIHIHTHILFFISFSIMAYHKMLNIVPYAIQ